jgi:hypothetical protein
MPDSNATYDRFIRSGLAAGFTDDQIDFLWSFLAEDIEKLETAVRRMAGDKVMDQPHD